MQSKPYFKEDRPVDRVDVALSLLLIDNEKPSKTYNYNAKSNKSLMKIHSMNETALRTKTRKHKIKHFQFSAKLSSFFYK